MKTFELIHAEKTHKVSDVICTEEFKSALSLAKANDDKMTEFATKNGLSRAVDTAIAFAQVELSHRAKFGLTTGLGA